MPVTTEAVSDVGYYTSSVGGGMESYYLDATNVGGEPPGRWSGKLAARFGLTGEVDADAMHDLYGSFTAPDGTKLGQAPGQYATPDERLLKWIGDHPDALPEEIKAARRRIEATGRKATLGVDLTFSVQKSVSALHTALWRGEIQAGRVGDESRVESTRTGRETIEAAIEKANARMLKYYSESLAVSREAKHGAHGHAARWIGVDELAVASFFQHTSRSIQPQLHHHNVVLNKVRCVDGEYRAIDTRDLFAQQFTLSAIAHRVLAEELSAAGFRMVRRLEEGNELASWEVADVPQEVCHYFSERRKTIRGKLGKEVAKLEQTLGRQLTGAEVGRLKQAVTLKTRPGKSHEGEPWDVMMDRWQDELRTEIGIGLAPICDRALETLEAGQSQPAEQWPPQAVCRAAVAAASEKDPQWRRDQLMWEIEQRLPILGPGVDPVEVLDRLTDLALADRSMVAQVSGLDDFGVPSELGGPEAYTRPSDRRYASTDTLEGENAIRKDAIEQGGHSVPAAAVDGWLDEHCRTIGEDQREAVRGIASSSARISMLIGPAGTGKTFTGGALDGVVRGLSGGGRVHGLAVSQRAVDVLAEDGVQMVANTTVWLGAQKRLANNDHRRYIPGQGRAGGKPRPEDEQFRIRDRDILLVDESSMVSRAELERIIGYARSANARVVLMGDPRQLASVEAGGVMGLLDGHAETYTLRDVRRFEAHWEKEASLRLRDGDEAVLGDYDRHGRISDTATLEEAMSEAAKVAAADRMAGRRVVVVAGTNDEAAAVAGSIRDRLIEAGLVRPELGEVELEHHGGYASVGDHIMCRQNDRRLGVTNRQLYEVQKVGEDGSLTVAGLDSGELLRLAKSYVRDHVASGYAGTVHATQGMSVDAGYGITDGRLDAAALYVLMTRGKYMNRVFVATDRERVDPSAPQAIKKLPSGKVAVVDTAPDYQRPSGRAVLEDALRKDNAAQDAAVVALERDLARLRSMDTIHGRIEDAARILCRDRMERHLDGLAAVGLLSERDRARLGADQSSEHLSRLLRAAEQAGHDLGALLTHAVIDERGLGDARSVAQVLSSRITTTLDPSGGRAVGSPTAPGTQVPGGISVEADRYLRRLHARADERRRELGAQVAQEQPGWAVRHLGPVPAEPEARAEWERRAGEVAAHREVTGFDDQLRALPDAPGITSTERRASFTRAWEALGKPAEDMEEAAMSEGRLRVRMEAWELEKQWAPPSVDEALRNASIRSEDARVQAILNGTADEKAAAIAADQDGIAKLLDKVARTRDAWEQETAPVRLLARRAEAELVERGVDLDNEPDRTTAAEWLAGQRAAERAEEARRRALAEAEVADPVKDAALSERVDERAGDAAQVPTPRDEAWETLLEAPVEELVDYVEEEEPERVPDAAHQEMKVNPGLLEVHAAVRRAQQADTLMADRASLEATSDRLHVDEYDTAYDAEFRQHQSEHVADAGAA